MSYYMAEFMGDKPDKSFYEKSYEEFMKCVELG